MKLYKNALILICLPLLALSSYTALAQTKSIQRSATGSDDLIRINWHKPISYSQKGKEIRVLAFDNVSYLEEKNNLPYVSLDHICNAGYKMDPSVEVLEILELTTEEEACVNKKYLAANFETEESEIKMITKVSYAFSKFIPLRLNARSGKIEKVLSYRVKWQNSNELISARKNEATSSFVSSSLLASGKWYKIATTENAVYRIDKNFLQKMGINTGTIDPRNIKIYGSGGELLSERNSDFHYDDLNENAIYVQGETDGVFDNTDYILFYGQSPNKWKYAPGSNAVTRYSHKKHFYSDTVFYFLTVDNTPGKRIVTQLSGPAATYTTNTFDECLVHEQDEANLIKSGREFYGESFANTAQYTFNFNFPALQNDTVWIKTSLLGRDIGSMGAFEILYPGGSYSVTFNPTSTNFDDDIGKDIIESGGKNFIYTGGSNVIPVTVNRTLADETGWLNYIWVIARRSLIVSGSQMPFRDYRTIAPGRVSQYNLQGGAGVRIWDVTDALNVIEQQTSQLGNIYSFSLASDSLKEFIAFDGTNYKTPGYSAQIANQNLHSLSPADYIIVSHPAFLNQAQKLADLHSAKENYSYVIVTPDQIYNEFSSGMQDITAIRQFVRMLYNKASASSIPKYLLLFGDGSYLNKTRNTELNTNFIPTFQTQNSLSYISSKTSDDFFGFLDDPEGLIGPNGESNGNVVDIGVGRLPVHTVAEADGVTNKILQYYDRAVPVSSCCNGVTANAEDWRNWICLIADDANPGYPGENTFAYQTEGFASLIGVNKSYNIDKIYEDAYREISVPGGRRYPDVVTAINNRISRGALILGYSGHGGELGLSHEEIITVNQIQSWKNSINLPLFFTATCEFSRFDDPTRTSAGEYVLLNPAGGGIALFTTTRLAFSPDGQALGSVFYPASIKKLNNGKYPSLGDIIKATKSGQPNYMHFTLLGDPALTLSYPKENVSTFKINTHVTQVNVNDTVSALGKYVVNGFIADTNGNKLSGFSGTLYPTVFDKPTLLSTLDNAGNGPTCIIPFFLQKNVLYRGKTQVSNGDFSFSFIAPKDILYNYGFGKISYYAQSDNSDAAGYYSQMIVGGTSSNPVIDNTGPAVKLYMNNNAFVSGGVTNDNPYIYAEISDSSGINTTGNGIGHDIVATIDANTAHAFTLNDYYQGDLNKYQSGKVKYQVSNLAEGHHHLAIKVWDILNNSSIASTEFVVAKSAEVALAHVLNYPNPFSTNTKFFAEHNQTCEYLNIEIQIFTITGKIVKTLEQTVHTEGFRTEGINWDGRDDFGDKLARGVYIYKVTLKTELGGKANKIEKLVILN